MKQATSFSNGILSAVAAIILFSVIIVGCKKNESNATIKNNNTENIIPFKEAARIHNQVLGAIAINLNDKGQYSYVSLEEQAKQIAYEYMDYKNLSLYKKNVTYGFNLRPSIFKDNYTSVRELKFYAIRTINALLSAKAIGKEEAIFIEDLFTILDKIESKKIVTDPIKEIDYLSSRFEAYNFDISSGQGIVAGYCISVAKASVRLWVDYLQKEKGRSFTKVNSITNTTDTYENEDGKNFDFIIIDPSDPNSPIIVYDPGDQVAVDVAPWVAFDIAGALGGAAGSILDNVFHRKAIDWRSAGAWAIGGAIGASAVGPVGRFLSRFAK
jgi:hypothetical protein